MATHLPIATQTTTNIVEDITGPTSLGASRLNHHFTTQHGGDSTQQASTQTITGIPVVGQHPTALVLSALPSQPAGGNISPSTAVVRVTRQQEPMDGVVTSVSVAAVGGPQGIQQMGGTPVGGGAAETDLHQVLSGLQQSGELNSVLQHQPHLVEDLSAIAAGDVSSDPEHLRFQYSMAEPEPPVSGNTGNRSSKRTKPTVYREQDRFLPIHNVARIMRNAIPKNGKVSKDAKECMQECVSEFVSFITSEASDKCIQEKRKTITGDDILLAMATLGFDNYIEPLKLYLQKYREFTKADKLSASGNLPSGSLAPMTPLDNGTTNPQQVIEVVPNMGGGTGTITMATTPVTIPTSNAHQRHQPTTALGETYSGFSGQIS